MSEQGETGYDLDNLETWGLAPEQLAHLRAMYRAAYADGAVFARVHLQSLADTHQDIADQAWRPNEERETSEAKAKQYGLAAGEVHELITRWGVLANAIDDGPPKSKQTT